jgi:hypothetical protein
MNKGGDKLSLGKISFPINIAKNKLVATNTDGKKIKTTRLYVTTPAVYAEPVKQILDGIEMQVKTLPAFIPSDLRREEPDVYYALLGKQAQFIHEHHNIPIKNVEPGQLDSKLPTGQTLRAHLLTSPGMHRVYYDGIRNRIQISTVMLTLKLPYKVSKIASSNPSIRSTVTWKYTGMFFDAQSQMSEASSFDPSTIKTTRRNAWIRRPPMRIEYALTADSFPPLPKKHAPPDTATTTASTSDDIGIDKAIHAALKKVEANFSSQMADLTTQMDNRMTALKQSMQAMVAKILGTTYTALTKSDSPFATKADHLQMQVNIHSLSTKIDSLLMLYTNQNCAKTPPQSKRQDMKHTPLRGSDPLVSSASVSVLIYT